MDGRSCHFGQIPKMTVHKKLLINKKFWTKSDDLGVIIMRKRCSIQQGGRKITVDQSKVLKNRLFRFLGPPGIWLSNCQCGKTPIIWASWMSYRNTWTAYSQNNSNLFPICPIQFRRANQIFVQFDFELI